MALLDPRPCIKEAPQEAISGIMIHEGFLEISKKIPAYVAIREPVGVLTFSQVDRFSEVLARQLLTRQFQKNRIVAIYGKRSASLIVSVLACCRAGLTFAILDSAYPNERLVNLAKLIEPSLILGIDVTLPELHSLFNDYTDTDIISVTLPKLKKLVSANKVSETENTENKLGAIAYLLFTSGTTGIPKCIKTSHAPLVHFTEFYKNTFKPEIGSRFSMLSGLSHDPLLRDIFIPLSTGGEICIPDAETIRNPKQLFTWYCRSKINYSHVTPQIIRLLCAGAEPHALLPELRMIFSGGDVLRPLHVTELNKIAPKASIVNFYGTTETPQAMAYHVINQKEDLNEIPIGRGIADVQILVLRDDLSLADINESGEIGIRTQYLSLGYLNDDSMTSARFIHSPFGADEKDLLYMTGDYGSYRCDGAVVMKGRIDQQVKIRGFRVELAEVVNALENESWVKNAAVLPKTLPNGENVLLAYVVLKHPQQQDTARLLKSNLSNKLPAYMTPTSFVFLEELPWLPNGKLDRAALAKLGADMQAQEPEELSESNELVQGLIEEFKYILSLAHIDPHDSFIQLGGDSLSFIQASIVIEKKLGWLPDNWEKIALLDLAKQQNTGKGSFFHKIYAPVLVRAISIVLVVLGHFHVLDIPGSTDALFLAAGWSFGSYQLRAILETNKVTPILLTIVNVFIPVFLYTLLLEMVFSKLNWQSLLMISNFISPDWDRGLTYWFINILLQIYIILLFIFMLQPVRNAARNNSFQFALIALLISVYAAGIIHYFWDTNYLYNRVPHMKIWGFFLGLCIIYADNIKKRMLLTFLAILFYLGGYCAALGFFSVLFILFSKYIQLPKFLAYGINAIAASSLFIYLTHFQFHSVVDRTHFAGNEIISTIAAITGGYITWRAWSYFYALFLGFFAIHLTNKNA